MNRILISLFILIFLPLQACTLTNDFLTDKFLSGRIFEKPETNTDYDFTDIERIPIKLQVTQDISTRDEMLQEGQTVNLKSRSNVYYNEKIIVKRNEPVSAKIELIVDSGMNGIPYYIYLNDFKFQNLPSSKIHANYQKSGWNRTYWVLPLKWALTPLPPTGSLTNFIKGGHAKISTNDIITVYYYPNWK